MVSNVKKEIILFATSGVKRQLFRYGAIGGLINTTAYLLYLWLAHVGLDPKAAATICFAGGTILGFFLNKSWTFQHPGRFHQTFVYHVIVYAVAYLTNIGGLYIFVDAMDYPHEIVQLVLILLIACGLFVAQKYWIFSRRYRNDSI